MMRRGDDEQRKKKEDETMADIESNIYSFLKNFSNRRLIFIYIIYTFWWVVSNMSLNIDYIFLTNKRYIMKSMENEDKVFIFMT